MRIKILVLSLVVAALAITCSNTTIAFFTDSDNSINTFTVGNVAITNTMSQSGVCAEMQKDDECVESFTIENIGPVDAYVRIRVLVPTSLLSDSSPTLNITANGEFVESINTITISEIEYNEFVSTAENLLASGEVYNTSEISFEYILDSTATVEGEGTETSANPADLGIRIYAEAIQAQGFANATEAFNNF